MGTVLKVSDSTSSSLPVPGDILVMGDTYNNVPVAGAGHVAIVKSANATSITFVQQNTLVSSAISTKLVTSFRRAGSTRYHLEATGGFGNSGYYVKGVFTRAVHPKASPAIAAVATTASRVSTQPMKVALVSSGIVDLDEVVVQFTDPSGKQGNPLSFSSKAVSATPEALIVSPVLTQAGKWTVQIKTGGVSSLPYAFTMLK